MPQKSGLAASEEVQQTSQYTALEGLTTGAAEANPLQRFCDPVEQKLQAEAASDEVEEELYKGWQAVIARAAETSHTDGGRSALAAFLVGLTQKRADGQQANSDYGVVQEMKVWRDLPLFGWQIRDAWNFAANDQSSQSEKEYWKNLNALTATLVDQLHDKASDNPDLSLFGIWTIRSALEEDNISDVAISAASVWFIYAASTLLSFSKDKKCFEGKIAKGGFAHKDAGWTGYSPARWQVWQQRLDSIGSEVQADATRKLLQLAIESIGKAK